MFASRRRWRPTFSRQQSHLTTRRTPRDSGADPAAAKSSPAGFQPVSSQRGQDMSAEATATSRADESANGQREPSRDRACVLSGHARVVASHPRTASTCDDTIHFELAAHNFEPSWSNRGAMKRRIVHSCNRLLSRLALGLRAQWLNQPTAGVPRLADGRPNLSAPAPRTADGKPDLSGVWRAYADGEGVSFAGAPLPALFRNIGAQLKDGLPYRPWARALTNARQADNLKDSPDGKMPAAQHPVAALAPVSLQDPADAGTCRHPLREGRRFPAGVHRRPIASRRSSAVLLRILHWHDGRETHWWSAPTDSRTICAADLYGNPLTESATVTERFRRPDFGNLEIVITVDDPKAYTAPFDGAVRQQVLVDTDLLEFICLENEKDQSHLVGK